MNRWLVTALLLAGCHGSTPEAWDLGFEPDTSAEDSGSVDELTFLLGPRMLPFAARIPGDDIVAVYGPQGGVHTEHAAFIGQPNISDVHKSLIWVEVARDGAVLARAGWEFWDTEWTEDSGGFATEMPVLIFDDFPTAGPITLRGELELADGREALYEEDFELVE